MPQSMKEPVVANVNCKVFALTSSQFESEA